MFATRLLVAVVRRALDRYVHTGPDDGATADDLMRARAAQAWMRHPTASMLYAVLAEATSDGPLRSSFVESSDASRPTSPRSSADINVIDFEQLMPRRPTIVHDLPAGRRLLQRADGDVATIVSGKVAFREGEPTGQLSGRLVRGLQPAPGSR